MASRFGSQLLEDVKEEGLNEFLTDLRNLLLPQPRDILGIPHIDRFLETIRYPKPPPQPPRWTSPGREQEGGLDASVYHDDEQAGPHHPETQDSVPHKIDPVVLEISPGSTSKSFSNSQAVSTTLCIYLAALAVLPPRNGLVVYINTNPANEGDLASRIYAQMLQILQIRGSRKPRSSGPISSTTAHEDIQHLHSEKDPPKAIALQSLSHIQIYTPTSNTQLLSILSSLTTFPNPLTHSSSSSRPLKLLIIDPLNPFHWRDRFSHSISMLETTSNNTNQIPNQNPNNTTTTTTKTLQHHLQTLLTLYPHSTLLYATTPTTTTTSPPLPTIPPTLTLSPQSLSPTIPLFPPHITISEAETRDREARKQVLQRGGFECILLKGKNNKRTGNKEEEEKEEKEKRWRFGIKGGVVIENANQERGNGVRERE